MDVLTVSMSASMLPHPPERVRHGGASPPWCGLPVDANPAGGQPRIHTAFNGPFSDGADVESAGSVQSLN